MTALLLRLGRHRPLFKTPDAFLADARAMGPVVRWLEQGTDIGSLLTTPYGFSQGAILSPPLRNLYVRAFDSALAGAKIPCVPLAADFLLFAPARYPSSASAPSDPGPGPKKHPRST